LWALAMSPEILGVSLLAACAFSRARLYVFCMLFSRVARKQHTIPCCRWQKRASARPGRNGR
jgi:hypothetical protein